MSDTAQTIYEADDIKAIYQPGQSDYVVFSFNGMGFVDNGEAFFGARFFASRRIAAVGIVDTKSTWYRHPLVADAIAAIAAFAPLHNGQRRVTYGASMGAYGALKYGRALDAHAAIAIGPQTSIDPSRVAAFDRRYQRFFVPSLHERMDVAAVDLCPHNFVFFDPASPLDRRHVAMLPKAEAIQPIVAPFIGHPGIAFFTQLRLIEQLLPLVANSAPDAGPIRRLIRSKRRKSPEYWFNRADFMRKHQPPLAERTPFFGYREALRLSNSPVEHADTLKLLAGYADALLDAGRRGEAQPILETLDEQRQRGHEAPGLLALLTKGKQFAKARAVSDMQAQAESADPEVLLERAKLLMLSGDVAGANAAVDAALPLAKRNVMAWRHLRWLYLRLGREADVAAAETMLVSLDAMPKNMGRKPNAAPLPKRG